MHQNTSESAMVSVIIPVYNVQMYLAECADARNVGLDYAVGEYIFFRRQ